MVGNNDHRRSTLHFEVYMGINFTPSHRGVTLLAPWLILAFLAFCCIIILTTHVAMKTARIIHRRKEKRKIQECLQVTTDHGAVMGTHQIFHYKKNVYNTIAFLGIPFARPPVRRRRFRKPSCSPSWKDVFNATFKRPPCLQDTFVGLKGFVIDASNTTEDCLHLNVWIPSDCVSKHDTHAVVFWIYGGAFTGGGNSYDFYDGRFISGFGKVIVVVPNYRLGVLGFLNSQTDDAPGNMGLHDILLALSWVRNNIQYFGGNRHKILLAGQSAGAIVASLLMLSPLMPRFAFIRAYLMSGSSYTPLPGNTGGQAQSNFEAFAKENLCTSGGTSNVVQCLRDYNDARLLLWRVNKLGIRFMPSFDDIILPQKHLELFDRFFRAQNKEVMITTTHSEGTAFFELQERDVIAQNIQITNDVLRERFSSLAGVPGFFLNLGRDVLRLAGYNLNEPNYMGWKKLLGDVLFRCATRLYGVKASLLGSKVYYQEYWPKPSFSVFSGEYATHSEDVFMLFGIPFLYPHLATNVERATTFRMIKTLTAFAKDGSVPTLQDGSPWPLFNQGNKYPHVEYHHDGYKHGRKPRSCLVAEVLYQHVMGRTHIDNITVKKEEKKEMLVLA